MTKQFLILSMFAAACGGAGLSKDVRTDISTQMTSAQAPLSACYEAALKDHHKLQGTMVLEFTAAPSTGQFGDINVRRDDLNDPTMKQCVVGEVAKLKLAKPQSTRLAVSSYPLHFTPSP